jgi:imidazolonepropionase-like amidohydrolase
MRLVLSNVRVLDGQNPISTPQHVIVDGRYISSIDAEPPDTRESDIVVDLAGKTVMPGMALCHFHSTYRNLGQGAPLGNEFPPAYQALISEKNLQTALQHGYTSVIGAGGANEVEPGVKQAIEDGITMGPRFMPCGREISTTGHGSDFVPWHWGMPRMGAVRLCDGVEGFRLGVREEIKRGAEVIKLFVTGGHGARTPKTQIEMTRDEMAAAIETAHSRGVLIRGHIAYKPAILMAIELGIDIVDHCDDMDEEIISALLESGTFVVPSILYSKMSAAHLAIERPDVAAAICADLQSMCEILPQADKAGVRLLLGDDFGVPGLDHGQYGLELHTYVEDAGIAPLSLVRWATVNAAAVRKRDHELGTLEPGKLADLIVIEGNPTADIAVLADSLPVAVLKGGQLASGALPGWPERSTASGD